MSTALKKIHIEVPFAWMDELLRQDLQTLSLKGKGEMWLLREKQIREQYIFETTEILQRTLLARVETEKHWEKVLTHLFETL